ncbi:hypothetical protein NQ318_006783 [Aromia moschata]|uniref:Uncharacterized protein n=1 Tax=Aromia moschata TaxID=1265417 RepID=A0AAV8Y7G9_9CUCU|nr:hypothetical protein NQ318_006783 [Aromia moschata]
MSQTRGLFVFLIAMSAGCLVRDCSALGLGETLDILKVAKDVVGTIAKAWNILDQYADFSKIPTLLQDRTESRLFGRIGNITAQLDNLAQQVDTVGTATIAMVLQNLPDQVRIELRLNDLLDYMTTMNGTYKHLKNYVKEKRSVERWTLEDFSKHAVSHDSSSVSNLVERIHAFIVPNGRGIGIRNMGLLKLLKKYLEVILPKRHSLHETDTKTGQTVPLKLLKNSYKIHLEIYGNAKLMKRLRDFYKVTYIMKLISIPRAGVQKTVENIYTKVPRKVKRAPAPKNAFAKDKGDATEKLETSPESGRRYEYIEYENGRVLGRKQGCTRGTTKVDSWSRWLIWHCSFCFCLCDEQGKHSDRYFNMRPTIADTANNRVVTGLRFVKKNRIIHLQIQEGDGQDYHILSSEKLAIDLDDLEADEGSIFTGVRFKEIGSHLNFEIFTTKFDFDTGKLLNPTSTSIWKDNPNTDSSIENPRTKVRLSHPDIPIRSSSPSIPTSKSDQYVEFTHSDIDRDVAQTTVPFLDAQKVESLQAVPLSGAGIFHKGRSNSGGFIAPKIITYDFSKHLKTAFPSE